MLGHKIRFQFLCDCVYSFTDGGNVPDSEEECQRLLDEIQSQLHEEYGDGIALGPVATVFDFGTLLDQIFKFIL